MGRTCRLQWNIYNPFLPIGKDLINRFEQESLTVETWWEASFQILYAGRESWYYYFNLCCLPRKIRNLRERQFFVTDLTVNISVNGKINKQIRKENFLVPNTDIRNVNIKYEAPVDEAVVMEPGICHFYIEVMIEAQERLKSIKHSELDGLSEDLRTLRSNPMYSDLRLQSNLSATVHHVHSSIIHGRWNDFFRKHPKDANDPGAIVRMDISDGLLSDILEYMYTGSGRIGNRERISVDDMAELNRVIEKYGLGHLKKNFYGYPETKVVRWINNMCSMEMTFPVTGPPYRENHRVWSQMPFPDVRVYFDFTFCLSPDHTLRYELWYDSPIKPYATVVIKYEKGNNEPQTLHWRQQDMYYDKFKRTWYSRYLLSMTEETRKSIVEAKKQKYERRSIRFILCISSGVHSEDILNEGNKLPDQNQRLEVLSDHMFGVMEGRYKNMFVACSHGIPPKIINLHMEIFTARVRRWRNAIREKVPEENQIPDWVTCDVTSNTFKHILDFMYTGRTFDLSASELKEMVDFLSKFHLGYGIVETLAKSLNDSNTNSESPCEIPAIQ